MDLYFYVWEYKMYKIMQIFEFFLYLCRQKLLLLIQFQAAGDFFLNLILFCNTREYIDFQHIFVFLVAIKFFVHHLKFLYFC